MPILKSLFRWPVGLLRIFPNFIDNCQTAAITSTCQSWPNQGLALNGSGRGDEGYIPDNTNPNGGGFDQQLKMECHTIGGHWQPNTSVQQIAPAVKGEWNWSGEKNAKSLKRWAEWKLSKSLWAGGRREGVSGLAASGRPGRPPGATLGSSPPDAACAKYIYTRPIFNFFCWLFSFLSQI